MKVLAIGSGDKLASRLCLMAHDGAALLESIPATAGGQDCLEQLVKDPGRAEWEAKIQVRAVAGDTLEDQGEWDVVLLGDMDADALLRVLPRAHAASERVMFAPHAKVRAHDETGGLIVEQKAPVEAAVMLHVHNVRRCGGTGNFVYDLARCFPEFQHVALCVNDPNGDPDWIKDVSSAMRTLYAPRLTPEILDEINPRFVMLHATSGRSLGTGDPEQDHPYAWLGDGGRRHVISWHHIGTYPWVPCDLDVFVSEYVKTSYAELLPRMKDHAVIPPCTDLEPYAQIHRNSAPKPPKATTAGKACQRIQALIKDGRLDGWSFDSSPPGRVGQFHDYLAEFPFAIVWSGEQETWCRTVSEAMAAGCVTIAHRSGAIPEQITHGENGYLFEDAYELAQLLRELQWSVKPERLAEIAEAGRDWATRHVGFARMRELFYPYLMRGLVG